MPDPRYRRSPHTVGAVVAGEVTLLDTEAGQYFGLAGPGADVWELLEAPHTLDELVTTLCTQYEVQLDTCRTDVQGLLEGLKQQGLIEVLPG